MYAAEMQRSLYYHAAAASQRSPLGLSLGFQPGVPNLPPHMGGHPFGHLAAMAGIPSLSHASQMPGSYNLSHSSPSNAPSNSMNLIQSRNHSAASPVAENAMKSRSTVPSPAHSSSNIPSVSAALPKHYLPPHKYPDPKKHSPSTSIAPPAHHESSYMSNERHTNSSSNRNSSNHNSNSSNSHLNAEQLKQHVPKSMADQAYAMRDRIHRTGAATSPYMMGDVTAADCKYSISLEKVKSNLVTNNESRSEPMELSVSSDTPQAKFNAEQISPKKLHLSSDINKLKTMMHFTNNEESTTTTTTTNNGCQERSNEVKDLSGRFSSYDPMQQQQQPPATNQPIMATNVDREADANQQQTTNSADIQRSVGQSPDNVALSKEPIVTNTNTNSTSLEHDSTISNSEQQQIANNKDSKLSKMDTDDVEPANLNANQNKSSIEHETCDSIENDAAKSTAAIKSPRAEPPNTQPDELGDNRDNSPNNSAAIGKSAADTVESNSDFDNAKKSPNTADTDTGDGTAVAVENVEQAKQTKS